MEATRIPHVSAETWDTRDHSEEKNELIPRIEAIQRKLINP